MNTCVIDGYGSQSRAGLGQQCARARIYVQTFQRRTMLGAKTDRMTSLALQHRYCDRRAFNERRTNQRYRLGLNERHVAERDDPALGFDSRAHRAGETGAHTRSCRGAFHDSGAVAFEQRSQRLITWPDDRRDSVERRLQRTQGGKRNRRAVRQPREQLVAAET